MERNVIHAVEIKRSAAQNVEERDSPDLDPEKLEEMATKYAVLVDDAENRGHTMDNYGNYDEGTAQTIQSYPDYLWIYIHP